MKAGKRERNLANLFKARGTDMFGPFSMPFVRICQNGFEACIPEEHGFAACYDVAP